MQAHSCHKEEAIRNPPNPVPSTAPVDNHLPNSQLFDSAPSLHFPVLIFHFVGSLCVARMVSLTHSLLLLITSISQSLARVTQLVHGRVRTEAGLSSSKTIHPALSNISAPKPPVHHIPQCIRHWEPPRPSSASTASFPGRCNFSPPPPAPGARR